VNLQDCQIYDISPLLSSQIAVFPGDTPFQLKSVLDLNSGDNLTLSSLATTVHLGAHADAPSHYLAKGKGISDSPLNVYLGPVQVIRVQTARGQRVSMGDLNGASIVCPRVLFRTDSFPDPNHWNGDFVALAPELIDYLAEQKVILVGLDTPSVDLADDRILLAHQKIGAHRMAILEGLELSQIEPGLYNLVALPLKIQNCDASPVRAILIRPSQHKDRSDAAT